MQETQKDAEQFLTAKLAARKAAAADENYVDPKIIRLESKESNKVTAPSKGAITCIDWSMDGAKIVVCFKQHNQIVVWDVQSTQRLIQIDFSVLERPQDAPSNSSASLTVYKVAFDKISSDFLLVSGEKAHLVRV